MVTGERAVRWFCFQVATHARHLSKLSLESRIQPKPTPRCVPAILRVLCPSSDVFERILSGSLHAAHTLASTSLGAARLSHSLLTSVSQCYR